jgi:hypothetical protein
MVSSGNSRHAAFFSALRSVVVNSLAPDAEACPAVIATSPCLGLVHGHPVGRAPATQAIGHIFVAQRTIRKLLASVCGLKISAAQQLRRLFGGIPVVHSTLLDPEARDPFTTFGDFATVYPEMQNSRFRL